jgi:hypothetical protein
MYNQLHIEWAEKLFVEIINDESDWFYPWEKNEIFIQAFQKFMTRNLNPYWFESIAISATEPEEKNKALPLCYEFADLVRQIHPMAGQFGKMPLWKVPPGMKILPHTDNFKYHRSIYRNIFIVSNHSNDVEIIVDGKRVEVQQGSLFVLQPATQEHSFSNNSNKDWYFLGFDFWNKAHLAHWLKEINANDVLDEPERLTSFGTGRHKFLSRH